MRVVVDTPVWSLALRRRRRDLNPEQQRLFHAWQGLVREDRTVLIGPVRQEVLCGIRNDVVFERLREHLSFFPDEPIETGDYEQAARFFNLCQSKGIAGTHADLLICAVAHRLGIEIFTTDSDFELYAEHLPVKLHKPRDATS